MTLTWTPNDNRLLAKYRRAGMYWSEVAELLDRSKASVIKHAERIGLTKRHKRNDLVAYIRDKHALGWSDADIAVGWNRSHSPRLSRERIGSWRAGLGLGSNRFSVHVRRKVSIKTQEQCRLAGVPNLAAVRSLAYQQFAARNGWPADIRPRAIQILNLLYERGPHSRPQICQAIGLPWRGTLNHPASRKALASNDREGSYLANLVARGLVVQLPRLVKGNGKGRSMHLYAIAPNVRRNAS